MKLLKEWQQVLERRHSAGDLTRPGQRPGEFKKMLLEISSKNVPPNLKLSVDEELTPSRMAPVNPPLAHALFKQETAV